MHQLLEWLALPQFGLGTVFIVSFVSATLLPVGSEAAVFGLIKLNPDLFWPAIGVATLGNTLGGGVSWWMGLGAHRAWDAARRHRRLNHPTGADAKPARELSRTARRAKSTGASHAPGRAVKPPSRAMLMRPKHIARSTLPSPARLR